MENDGCIYKSKNFIERSKAVVLTPTDLTFDCFVGTYRPRLARVTKKISRIRIQLNRILRTNEYCVCLCVSTPEDISKLLWRFIKKGYYGPMCVRVGYCDEMAYFYEEIINVDEYMRFKRNVLGELNYDPDTKRVTQNMDNQPAYYYRMNYFFYSDVFDRAIE
ncbi:ORF116 [Leucania separata nucleopolyhedrovirus]|uniref:ORF116 n=1 Tax=Leucania separata nucleopolyhedrovirus TaxID=1307956 RepID=Q0IL03_NPVLS|nr:ORF116 [Leucania separata nucleopolyhedrovirus]AAR28880.1 ORF116 [Leucania separata nucleopolyhedrovirus]